MIGPISSFGPIFGPVCRPGSSEMEGKWGGVQKAAIVEYSQSKGRIAQQQFSKFALPANIHAGGRLPKCGQPRDAEASVNAGDPLPTEANTT